MPVHQRRLHRGLLVLVLAATLRLRDLIVVERGGDGYLTDFVGARGLLELTSWIDVGEWHDSEYAGPEFRDLREWTTLFRRLHVPYYEEARHCTQELRDELDCGANQNCLYLPDTLKHIIEEHESRAA